MRENYCFECGSYTEIDVLVTDAGIAAEDAARLQDAGVDVVTA